MTNPSSGSAAPTAERAAERIGQVIANRYRLDALLGLGATGAVYRAAHPGGHAVAIKILDPELMASDVATRFARESELMLSIHHPNVVRTLAAGRDETHGLLYLAMPLLQGEDLDAVLQRTGALDPTTAVRVALSAARGIAAAHRLGVVHRDIKPGNLFIDVERDGKVAVRVCDFGIAKSAVGASDVSLTRTGSQLGTPDYISPEQLKDSKSVDQRADVWGLGATLYEMLSGRPPFAHHERVFDVISAILGENVAWLQDKAPWIEADLALVVHGMLRRDPAERPQTMERVVEALLPFSSGDGAILRTNLAPVSPVLRKVAKPRGEPPVQPTRRPVPSRGERAAVAQGEARPQPPPARDAPPILAPSSEAARPQSKNTKRKKRGGKRGARPAQRSSRNAGCLFLLLAIVAAGAASVVFRKELGPLLDPLLAPLNHRP